MEISASNATNVCAVEIRLLRTTAEEGEVKFERAHTSRFGGKVRGLRYFTYIWYIRARRH